MSFGIYCIKNKVNDKYYIGSTITSFKQRWSTHKNKLNQNTHANEYLQHSWNKYGEDNFEFNIVEECDDKSDVLELEQLYLDFTNCTDREYGYNMALFSTSPNKGRKEPEEVTMKRVAARRNSLSSVNTSGYNGVRLNRGRWNAATTINQKHIHLGMADSAEEAHKMYEECKNKSLDEIMEWKKQYTKQRKSKTLSKYHGITYVKSRNSPKKWYSVIVVDKVTVFQKYFLTELEAAIAYNNFIITNKLNKKLNEL